VDADYRALSNVSGILAAGAEFNRFSFTVKTASRMNGVNNNENAWLLGADFTVVPVERLKLEASGFGAVNYDKAGANNPYTFGTGAEYQLLLKDTFILTPFAGFDFIFEKTTDTAQWETGLGVMLYTKGQDARLSSRILDYDEVIPVGFSLAMNINENSRMNALVSWFDPAGADSLIPNFGGFLQLEAADILAKSGNEPDFAVLVQVEYSIKDKVIPYLRGGYKPEITGQESRTGNFIVSSAAGCYIKPVNNFAIDIWYKRNDRKEKDGMIFDSGVFSSSFTISF
jgi:hypothetical protein